MLVGEGLFLRQPTTFSEAMKVAAEGLARDQGICGVLTRLMVNDGAMRNAGGFALRRCLSDAAQG